MADSIRAWIVIALVLTPTELQAGEHYYFNKPNVDRDQYIADKVECDRLAGGVSAPESKTIYVPQNSNLSAVQNATVVGIASLFAGLVLGNENRKVIRAVERTCMADKGYGRYRVEKSFVQDIEKLKSQKERTERYFSLASAVQPVGERIKE